VKRDIRTEISRKYRQRKRRLDKVKKDPTNFVFHRLGHQVGKASIAVDEAMTDATTLLDAECITSRELRALYKRGERIQKQLMALEEAARRAVYRALEVRS
jgi:hypothetical protein